MRALLIREIIVAIATPLRDFNMIAEFHAAVDIWREIRNGEARGAKSRSVTVREGRLFLGART